ncbi:MAG: hypothetical protein WKG07_31795 [Hymenobacter sp.]
MPYAPGILSSRSNEYMIADQRFAAERPDVLTFQTPTPARRPDRGRPAGRGPLGKYLRH